MRAVDDETSLEQPELPNNVPYMRRSRAVAVRGSRFPRRLRWVIRGTLFAALILFPVGWGGYALSTYILNSPHFQMDSSSDITVSGNHFVSRENVLNALGVSGGSPDFGISIFRLSLVKAKKQIEAIPWVRRATLIRSYPHRLIVRVTERAPVAFVNDGGQIRMVDEDGVLLERPAGGKFDFPVVEGLDFHTRTADLRSRIAAYLDFMHETSETMSRSGWIVSEVDLSDNEDLQTLLVQGKETLLVHFGYKDFLARLQNFLTVLPELRKNNEKIDSVDLRYQDQVVVNPARAGTNVSPAAGPAAAGKAKGA